MLELLTNIAPNLAKKPDGFVLAIGQTLTMMGLSGAVSFVIGMVLGVVLTVTRSDGIRPTPIVFGVLDRVINIFRSIPFIILLAAVIPLTRLIAGTAIGTAEAIVPLVFGTVPFFTRQLESALAGVDSGLIQAAQAMGMRNSHIIWRVLLKESIPGIVRGTMITFVSLVGLTAMAGAVGAGGLGDFAIRYGYQRNQMDITWATVIVLLLLVSLIQAIGRRVVEKTTH